MLQKTKKNLIIDETDMNLLKKYNINIDNFKTLREVIITVEQLQNNGYLEEEEIDELDEMLNRFQELEYYNRYRK